MVWHSRRDLVAGKRSLGGASAMLHGKTALVTGSSQGIGLGVARAFLEAGARVVLTSERPAEACPEVLDLLKRPDTAYVQADLLQDSEPERLVASAAER